MGMRKGELQDKDRHEKIRFLASIPSKKDPWGDLAVLKGTPWEAEIPVVDKMAYTDAINGWAAPFRKALGTPARVRAKRLPIISTLCGEHQQGTCPNRADHCRPGSGKLPRCYEAPFEDASVRNIASIVAEAWDEDRFVIVIRDE